MRLKESQVHLTKSSSDIFKFHEKRGRVLKSGKETKSNGPKQISLDLLLISQLESYRPREDGTTYTESCDRKKLKKPNKQKLYLVKSTFRYTK